MMTLVDMTLAAEHAAAVARLDADLVIAASGSPDFDVHQLRSRAVSAYRAALATGAGKPSDSSWNLLALTVNAYVARVEATARTRDATRSPRATGLTRLRAAAGTSRSSPQHRRLSADTRRPAPS